MSAQINREDLVRCLEAIGPGLTPQGRETVEQSSCAIFKDGRVLSFNEEVACSAASSLNGTVSGAIQAAPLLEMLKEMPDEQLTVDVRGGELILIGKNREAAFSVESEIHLPINGIEKPGKWTRLHVDFAEAISLVHHCASDDGGKLFEATCVHVHPEWVEACDDHHLCRWTLKTGLKRSCLVRKGAIKHVAGLGMSEVSETEGWLHFRNPAGVILSCRRYFEQFPDLAKAFEVKGVKVTLPKGLEAAAKRAGLASAASTSGRLIHARLSAGKVRIEGVGVGRRYKERKAIKYEGPPIEFLVAPQLLMDLVKKHTDCRVSKTHLKAGDGAYVYVSCLHQPKQDTEAPGTEEAGGDD